MVVLRTLIQTSAVNGIVFFWLNFTVESLKMMWHIASPETNVKQKAASPEPIKQKAASPEPIVKQKKVMCESCYGYFLDDGGELIHGKFLCESCSDDLVRDQLEK